jgi:hypothetical protein
MSRRAPTWPRVAVVAAVLVLAFIFSRSCADSEIEISQDEAMAIATGLVDFTPEDPQIRFLRQGIDRHPFWIVSLSTLSADEQTYDDLVVVRIDATSGDVVELRDQDVKAGAPQATGGPDEAP